ncbi:MAG TPA: hypothetical protein VEZ55_06020 [Chitinophagaceae bacterium]|jgi:hypothetical protein|nr:hypothetical protein [Chitinophagaceae bacterium]
MQKQLTIVVPNASGEEGLSLACKRGDLFRNDEEIERYYSQGYRIHNYSIVNVDSGTSSTTARTVVRVFLEK